MISQNNNFTNSQKPFGWSLLIDIFDCSRGLGNHYDDFYVCYKYLDELPGFIGMEKQGPPVVIETDGKKYPDKAGYSGWVALVESGIQLHTLVPTHFITIDIYSCKKFSPKLALDFTKKYFHPKNSDNIHYRFLKRGENYHSQQNLNQYDF